MYNEKSAVIVVSMDIFSKKEKRRTCGVVRFDIYYVGSTLQAT